MGRGHKIALLKPVLLTALALLCFSAVASAMAQTHGQISHKFSAAAGGTRSFYVSLPKPYSATKTYKLLLIFPGTDATGAEMKEWVGDGWGPATGLEANLADTIFVYPDPEVHDFPGWGARHRGWLLGPNFIAESGYQGERPGASGSDPVRDSYIDINFTKELIDWLTTPSASTYKIDRSRVFATGHSWGGDMAAVVGCFLGDRITATAPVGANRPYWFWNADGTLTPCVDKVGVWTFFGLTDEHFASQQSNGAYGAQQNDFWRAALNCQRASSRLDVRILGETTEYTDCDSDLRLTLYKTDYSGDGDQPGHYPPDTYAKAVSAWFAGF